MKLLKTRDDLPGDLPAEETHYEAAKKNILIVDDSGFARKILKDMLESEGYNIVGEAGDGLEAIEMAKEKKPDFIFMDVAMPKLDGMGALPRIMEMNLNSKVIMSTAMGQKSIIVEAMKIGAIDYVIKPYKKENIIDVLNTHLKAEAKNSQVISFEEEKKHYIKEKTREAVVRDIKENVVKKEEKEEEKEEAKAAVSEEVPEETADVENSEEVIAEETLEAETDEEAVAKSSEEETSLELNDEEVSLELATEEESLELVTEEKSLEGTLDLEGTTDSESTMDSEGIAEIADLEGISDTNAVSEEESLQALDMEESTASVTDEAALKIDSVEEGLEAASQEESLNILDTEETLNIEESEKAAVKEDTLEVNSGAESPAAAVKEGLTGEAAGGTGPGQVVTEAVREEPVGNISGQIATEVTAGEKSSAIAAGQVTPETVTALATAASESAQTAPEVITAEKPSLNTTVQGTPEVPIGEQTAATAAVQEVTEAVPKAEVPEAVLNTDAVIGYESPQMPNGDAERYSFMTSIRREEEDTESAAYSYLWKNRFDARQDDNSVRRTLNEGNYVQNFCGLSTNGNDLSEEENSEQNMLFAMVNAYMNLNSRFDSENVTGQYLFRPYEGIRLPTVRVFGSEWYGRDEVSLSNILRYSNYNASQDRVYYEKNSLYLVVMHLVQSKADRILGQDRFKIFH